MIDMIELAPEHDIGPAAQIPRGEGRNFRVGGYTLAVFHTQSGAVFATQAHCPHRAGPLADGLLGGTIVVCPLHDRAYDLRTGDQAGGTCRLATYPARLTPAGTVRIALPASPSPAALEAPGR